MSSLRRAAAPAILLDKDGTLVPDIPYNVDPSLVTLLPGVGEGLRLLRAAGFRLVVVSNQSGVARGMFAREDLDVVAARVNDLLSPWQAAIDAFYWCPHDAPRAGAEPCCGCRKPLPGLITRAAGELGLDLASSWMIGDILNDVEAGHRAGCRAILVDRGGETEWRSGRLRVPDLTVSRFDAAARAIAAMAWGRETRRAAREAAVLR